MDSCQAFYCTNEEFFFFNYGSGLRGGGGAPGARTPKIGKDMNFWRKIVIFHTKYPKIFRASLRN